MFRPTVSVAVVALVGILLLPAPPPRSYRFSAPMAATVRPLNSAEKSTNWSGYAVVGTAFKDVRGTWTEPVANCGPSTTQFASVWVGMDGFNSSSVEQIGTDVDCIGGVPQYFAWYEMYPAGSVNLPLTDSVRPGDQLVARVSVSKTAFTLSMQSSAGWQFSVTQTSSVAQRSSAEWIVEAPEVCTPGCSIADLTDYQMVKFSRTEATVRGGVVEPMSFYTAGNGPFRITMMTTDGTLVRAKPTRLAASGDKFWDYWEHS